jgi:hypothetical protein
MFYIIHIHGIKSMHNNSYIKLQVKAEPPKRGLISNIYNWDSFTLKSIQTPPE